MNMHGGSCEIPGAIPSSGRQFIYIELQKHESHVALFDDIGDYIKAPKNVKLKPQSGALLEEDVVLAVPDGTRFSGFSYRGDLESWKNILEDYCNARGLLFAIVKEGRLLLSDDSSCELSVVVPQASDK